MAEQYNDTVAKAVGVLAATFGVEVDAMLLEAYSIALRSLTVEQVERATAVALEKNKFMPKPAELIELARTGGVSYEAQALVAFDELEHALDKNKPSLMPPLVAAVVRQIGGFAILHDMPISDFKTWKRKDFLAAYAALVRGNPERLAAIAGPSSGIAKALVGELRRLPSREETKNMEEKNRERLQVEVMQ